MTSVPKQRSATLDKYSFKTHQKIPLNVHLFNFLPINLGYKYFCSLNQD